MNIEELLSNHKRNFSQVKEELIQKAYRFARDSYGDKKRLSGQTLLDHSLCVANLLTEIELDSYAVSAGILHDVLERTETEREELNAVFPEPIPSLVDGVTIIKKVRTKTGEWEEVENIRKLLLASSQDVRVILIRLAEKLHNLETLKVLSTEKQKIVLSKTFDIYAPLAERLGVYHFKWQLEDLAFAHKNPEAYREIQKQLGATRQLREEYTEKVRKLLRKKLAENSIQGEVYGRAKHIYSIYKKLQRYEKEGKALGIDVSKIYDQVALRVIVNTVAGCYEVLSIIHDLWEPIEAEFDDYISKPKPSGYQALHTTVYAEEKQPLEIQIRTEEMHRKAEYGVAAHANYKEHGRNWAKKEGTRWLKELIKWKSSEEGSLDLDIFSENVFVLTPKGDVKVLPQGATPVDFAYAIHSDLGNRCQGAKVDGKLVSLDCELKNGQTVEILASPQPKNPSSRWLEFVKTNHARAHIRRVLNG
ncbi:MAG: RelA/SpoT family protein [Patescibacteria group bacterium]